MLPFTMYMSNIKRLPKISEILTINKGENLEPFEVLNNISLNIVCLYEKMDMKKYLNNNIVLRETVVKKLVKISNKLNKKYPGYKLKVVYGYRHPAIQLKYFKNQKSKIKKNNLLDTDEELNEKTHMFVADPRVAGHPTGGAVDVTITTASGDLDMGTRIADFSNEDKIKTFSLSINKEQKKNRKILHDLMTSEDFAPFYGEWWHFSYGDLEWAYFYNKKTSLYSAKEYSLK